MPGTARISRRGLRQDNIFRFQLAELGDGRTKLRFWQHYAIELEDGYDGVRRNLGRRRGQLAAPDHEQQVRHRQRARVGEMVADRLVKLGKLPLIGQAKINDHRAQAVHQVRHYRAARMTGRVGGSVYYYLNLLQSRLPV